MLLELKVHLLCSLLLVSPLFSMAVLTPIKITHGGGEENKHCSTRAHFRHFVIVCAFYAHSMSVCVCVASFKTLLNFHQRSHGDICCLSESRVGERSREMKEEEKCMMMMMTMMMKCFVQMLML